jgi:hypothetical protein
MDREAEHMNKDDNPFGSESASTDPFGRPLSDGDSFSTPAPAPAPAPAPPPATAEPGQAAPPPTAADPWRSGSAPPPTGDYAAPPTPGRKADGAVTALVLGIIGIVFCQLLAPVAWSLGRKAERQVDASGGTLGGRGEATAGKVLGIIGTLLLVIAVIALIALIGLGTSVSDDGGTTTTFEF